MLYLVAFLFCRDVIHDIHSVCFVIRFGIINYNMHYTHVIQISCM